MDEFFPRWLDGDKKADYTFMDLRDGNFYVKFRRTFHAKHAGVTLPMDKLYETCELLNAGATLKEVN